METEVFYDTNYLSFVSFDNDNYMLIDWEQGLCRFFDCNTNLVPEYHDHKMFEV